MFPACSRTGIRRSPLPIPPQLDNPSARHRSRIHDITLDSAGRPRKGYTPTTDPRKAQGALHPLVREHPRTVDPPMAPPAPH